MSKHKIVIIGGNGFVGELLSKLLSEQLFQVTVIDFNSCRTPLDKVNYVISDINKIPIQDLELLFEGSTIVQLAALSSSSLCEANPILALEANIEANLRLIEIANKTRSKVIFASSEWVYPNLNISADQSEDEKILLSSKTNFYTMTKIVGEWLFEKYCKEYQILRFGIVYGERFEPQSAIEKIVFDALHNSKIEVGNWGTARRFIHVEDLCLGVIECILGKTRFRLLNLSGSELVSLADIARLTELALGRILQKDNLGHETSIRNPVPELFYTEYKWAPKIPIDEGILRLVKYYREIERGVK